MEICLALIFLSSVVMTITADVNVRLVNGGSPCSGRVEVLHDGQWGTVCDNDWDLTDAAVVCRELGCGDPLGIVNFGSGSGAIWMDDVHCNGSESSLKNCTSNGWGVHNCYHSLDIGIICSNVNVRLVNGASSCSGRVEVLHGGQWGTVCDDGWDITDAGVVCRELGCGDAVQVLHMSHFGSGSGQIWMDDVSCNGSESTLLNCQSRGWGVHDCNLNTNAGVICSNLSVKLVSGDNRCAGRVEVLQGGQWITMCGSVWDLTNAEVVCRELGCGKPLGIAHFGPASGPIWTEQMHCNGSESTLKNCRSSGSNVQYCGHHHDAGVICSILKVRLVNGDSPCSGRVEVLHDGQWGTVFGDGWDLTDASVVCSEMGCGDAVQVLNGAHFGRGSGKIWMNDVDCIGSECTLKNCTSSVSDCDHDKDVGVICSNVNVRLVNGSSACSGRVEILHGRQWGTVCDFSWDLIDAAAVCRELDCGEPVQALHDAHFGQGSGPIWLDYVRCKGSESSLKNCVANQWGVHYCSHIRDAGVMCSDGLNYGWSRFVAGSHLCSGRVEMYYGGRWGTVCDAAFDAEVVCRELNCGVPVQLLGADAFGEGEGHVWTQDIQCRGNESHINLCPQFFKTSSKKNCSHDNDVGVICSGYKAPRLVNGSDICSGRVELQYLDEWGTVCDGCMNMRAASVVCRQLNCGIAVSVVGVDWFGEGSGEIWADVFDCQGNETQLSQCSISSWSRAEYSHKQDVGVICSNSSLSLHDGGVRLSGERECEGVLEVYIDQVWRRVLLDSWSVTESSVVCRQLGCGSVLNFSGSSSSSAEHSHECVMGFKCSGTEHHLRNCSSSTQTLNCSSTQHLSITCLGQRSIRLVGSGGDCAGRLEVFHKGSWGTVCDDSWDIKDAHVVCRQLQCGVALSDQPVPAWFGPGSGPIWLDDVNCEGNETSLWNCSSRVWGDHDCNHKEDVGVVCSEFKEIRLSEGCEGNVEVFYNGSWGNVCWNQMDRDTASLICQELNCGRSASEPSSSKNGLKTHNWLDKLKCRSHDSTLWQCPSSLWAQNDCGPSGIVKITCSEKETHQSPQSRLTCSTSPSPHQRQCSSHVPLRLSGGKGRCSGRLEVYHNSEWGSVCDDLWDIRDAQVVCRQLGCGAALSADGNEAFGAGEGVVWLNRVECRGTEIHLWDCPHILKNHSNCSHKEHVELICADLSAFTTPATTTTPTSLPLMSESLFIPPVVVIVLGVLLLLLLVPLLILIQHNSVMRRALSKRRHWTQTEAVYEEIEPRHINRHFTQRERHSGYEDVNEPFTEEDICVYDNDVFTGSPLKAKQVKKVSLGYYNDVDKDEPTADIETGDIPENYDDVIIFRHNIDGVNDGVQEEYDDVRHIGADKSGMEEDCETGVQEEYDDVKNVRFVKPVRP